MTSVTAYDGITYAFREIKILNREVAYEQMSKAGNAVRVAMRESLTENRTAMVTRVGKNRKPFLERSSSPVVFGNRESMTINNMQSNPPNMSAFITSFLMEKSGTLVVGGANPRFVPIIRRNGEVVGQGTPQGAVSPSTIAILHRMDTGSTDADGYPTRSRLREDITPRHFMSKGIMRSSGTVRAYLAGGFLKVMREAQRMSKVKVKKREIA